MKYLISFIIILTTSTLLGQNNDPEHWRLLGYQSKTEGDFVKAILQYNKVLTINHEDYDARLALGRLYQKVGSLDSAIHFYHEIYKNDSTDVEALNGLGECYITKGKYTTSIRYFEKALAFLPDYVVCYLNLAKAYSYNDQLDKAIATYQKINKIDSTYAEAWAGLGKMHYWKGLPYAAAKFYRKALSLDSENDEYKKEFANILEEIKPGLSIKLKPLRETEESYDINALINSIKFEKRLNDYFHLDANFLLDYSKRNFTDNTNDTTRWFNNAWISGSLLMDKNRFSLYSGYSASDKKVTSYGINWSYNTNFGKISLKNTLTGGYDYFYYWNKVGSKSIAENLKISYGIIRLISSYTLGSVDPVIIKDVLRDTSFTNRNDFSSYGFSLSFRVLARPDISIAINHTYLDYKYKSKLYYSPFGRRLSGVSVSAYHTIKKFFFYGNYMYNVGTEHNYEIISDKFERVNLNVDNWSADAELGYLIKPLSFSIGVSRFYNPYYQSLSGFITVKALL